MNIVEEEFLWPSDYLRFSDPSDGGKDLVFGAVKRAREEWDAADDIQKAAILQSRVFSAKMFNEAVDSESESLRQAALQVWESGLSSAEAQREWSANAINTMVEREEQRVTLQHESNRAPVAAIVKRERITVPSGEPYYHLWSVLARPHQLKADEGGWPAHNRSGGKGSMSRIQLKPEEATSLLPAGELDVWIAKMWEKQRALNDLDADCLDILMTLWIEKAKTLGDVAVVDIDDLIEMRGLEKNLSTGSGRRGGYTEAQRNAHFASLCRLKEVRMEFEGPVVKRGQGKRARPEVIQSYAVVITDLKGQRRLDGAIDVDKIVFQPGRVFGAFLQREGRQTALLAHKALKYNPSTQGPEKRLTRYLTWQWRIRAHRANYEQPFSVQGLVDEAGIEIEVANPARAQSRLEKALYQLKDDGIINNWDYRNWEEERDGGKRGWRTVWLNATVIIEAPDAIKDHYRKLERELPPAPKLKPGAELAARLAAERKARRISQAVMAEILGVTPPHVCNIERGHAKISAKLRTKIEAWLQSCQADEAPEGPP